MLNYALFPGASDDLRTRLDAFRSQLSDCAKTCLPPMKGSWWAKKSADQISALFSRIWAFGPARAKPNILFDGTFIGEQNGGEQGNNDNIASIWEGEHISKEIFFEFEIFELNPHITRHFKNFQKNFEVKYLNSQET